MSSDSQTGVEHFGARRNTVRDSRYPERRRLDPHKRGQIYTTPDGDHAILAQVDGDVRHGELKYTLIMLENGNRYCDPLNAREMLLELRDSGWRRLERGTKLRINVESE